MRSRRRRSSLDRTNKDNSEEENLVHEEDANEEEANDSFDENGETKDNWKWFLTLLEEDLGTIRCMVGILFRSTKGLVPALKEVMPRAHHQLRMRHVRKNFMKQWRDKQLRGLVWECARCTTIPKFEKSMREVKALNEATGNTWQTLIFGAWVKAYYSHWPKCDNITNNVSEVWNSKIRNYRQNPFCLCVRN
ncbi:hypothetical protein K1719_032939 [Acacia pycnantha]|nr:hypothetical protein K1719_032939 [Acacia pycnantha]